MTLLLDECLNFLYFPLFSFLFLLGPLFLFLLLLLFLESILMLGMFFLFTDIPAFVSNVINEDIEFFNRIDGKSLLEDL